MINGLNPGLSLFTTDGAIMYAIMLGLILVNIFMFLQGKYLTSLFCKGRLHPPADPDPHIIVIFCFAGAYSVNSSYFDLSVALVFGVMAWFMRKLELPAVPVLLGHGAGQYDRDELPPRPAHLGRQPRNIFFGQRVLLDLHCADRGGYHRHPARQDEGNEERESGTVKGR